MAIFQEGDEMPPVCHYCGKFMEKKDDINGRKVWKCVNPGCKTNQQPHKISL